MSEATLNPCGLFIFSKESMGIDWRDGHQAPLQCAIIFVIKFLFPHVQDIIIQVVASIWFRLAVSHSPFDIIGEGPKKRRNK